MICDSLNVVPVVEGARASRILFEDVVHEVLIGGGGGAGPGGCEARNSQRKKAVAYGNENATKNYRQKVFRAFVFSISTGGRRTQ